MATQEDVDRVKRQEQIRAIKRKGNLDAWSKYIGFWTAKISGLATTTIGGFELIDPAILPIVLASPGLLLGIGISLLTGKRILKPISLVIESLRKQVEEEDD